MRFTAAASDPLPEALKEYSPSARHLVVVVAEQRVAPATPFSKRGSKAQAAPPGTAGPANVCAVPPPSGVKVRFGVIEVVERFWTTIVLIVPVRPLLSAFFAAYGP